MQEMIIIESIYMEDYELLVTNGEVINFNDLRPNDVIYRANDRSGGNSSHYYNWDNGVVAFGGESEDVRMKEL